LFVWFSAARAAAAAWHAAAQHLLQSRVGGYSSQPSLKRPLNAVLAVMQTHPTAKQKTTHRGRDCWRESSSGLAGSAVARRPREAARWPLLAARCMLAAVLCCVFLCVCEMLSVRAIVDALQQKQALCRCVTRDRDKVARVSSTNLVGKIAGNARL
jgi:hypothetical protein